MTRTTAPDRTTLVRVVEGRACVASRWEEAYRRFETPAAEVRKFRARLLKLGAGQWPRDARIAEIFCGHGNGLVALEQLGFENLSGVDLSAELLAEYRGPARCYVADCRQLPLDDSSQDIVIVQGGLHHLPAIPEDLERTASDVRRVLCADGRFVVVEPWQTPFLSVVHRACRWRLARRLWPRLDALATMIELEEPIYPAWLARPRLILDVFDRHFTAERQWSGWGKLYYVGRRRSATA